MTMRPLAHSLSAFTRNQVTLRCLLRSWSCQQAPLLYCSSHFNVVTHAICKRRGCPFRPRFSSSRCRDSQTGVLCRTGARRFIMLQLLASPTSSERLWMLAALLTAGMMLRILLSTLLQVKPSFFRFQELLPRSSDINDQLEHAVSMLHAMQGL